MLTVGIGAWKIVLGRKFKKDLVELVGCFDFVPKTFFEVDEWNHKALRMCPKSYFDCEQKTSCSFRIEISWKECMVILINHREITMN